MTFRIRPFTNYRAFSPTWPASMQIYWSKRKLLHKKRVQLPEDILGTPMWPPRRHVKTLYSKAGYKDLTEPNVHMHVASYQLKAHTNTPTNSFFCSFILYIIVQKVLRLISYGAISSLHLHGQKSLAPLAKRSTCSKSILSSVF